MARAALILAGLSAASVAAALFWPLGGERPSEGVMEMEASASTMPVRRDLGEVLEKLSARRTPLICPPQAQAAVKDSGAAARLAKKLKLQGIVQMGSDYVAYIQTDEGTVRTVRRGDTLLEFVVGDVTDASVTLSLEGVEVLLGH
jgi:hypothetical protein